MIELSHVTKRYGQSAVLEDISLSLDECGICCLLGRNGAGKTTLLKSIAGYQNITSGEIKVNGKRISASVLETDVSYIENFAGHFNLPVHKLIRLASEVSPDYDYDFALEMMDRFELDGREKFRQLSLGMKTMVSTIICLSSSKAVILLDEPVLGFDAIMRVEFYDMLAESFCRKPRIIIVSTHIIEEIAETVHRLIIIDKGRICFYDTMKAVGEKSFAVSGFRDDVEDAVSTLNVISREMSGGLETAYIYDTPPAQAAALKVCPMSLQDLFIRMVGHKGGRK